MATPFFEYLQYNFTELASRFFSYFSAPFENTEAIWPIIPLIITIIVMEFYWAKYKNEEPGWNTVTANCLVLIFVSMDLMRYLYENSQLSLTAYSTYGFSATILVIIMALQGITVLTLNFIHLWPKFLAYSLSSQFTINLVAYLLVVIIYSQTPLNLITLISGLGFIVLMNVLFFVIRMLYPSKD